MRVLFNEVPLRRRSRVSVRATEALAHGHREWRTFTTGAISRPAFPHPCIRSMVSLDRYCAECVIGGPGFFMISVHQAEDFASRSERPHAGMERPASHCHWPINWLEEERLRPSFLDPASPASTR